MADKLTQANQSNAQRIKVKVTRLPHYQGTSLPAYETPGSAGMDLTAALSARIRLAPLERQLIPTGLKLEIPASYEAQVRPRSGLALKSGLTVLNSPGTIDSDYRGEISVILINLGQETQWIEPGDRMAQLVIVPVCQAQLIEVEQDKLSETDRGQGGFGSTGQAASDQPTLIKKTLEC